MHLQESVLTQNFPTYSWCFLKAKILATNLGVFLPSPPGYAGQRDPQVLNLPAPNFHLGRERHSSPFHPRLPCSSPAMQAAVHVRVEMGVSIGIYRFMNSLPSGGFCMGGFRQYMWYPLSQPSQNSNWSYNRRNCHDQGITSQWFYL